MGLCLVGSKCAPELTTCSKLVAPVANRNPYSCMSPCKGVLERSALSAPHPSLVSMASSGWSKFLLLNQQKYLHLLLRPEDPAAATALLTG